MKQLFFLGLLLTVAALPSARAQDLLNSGATISLTGGATLSVSGALQNTSGTLDLSSGANQLYVGGDLVNASGATLTPGIASTVTLNGTAAQQLNLNGAQLYNLTVNKPSGTVSMPAFSNADVAGALTLSGGMVTTDPSATLRLLNGATLNGEQSGRYVKGNLAAVKANVPAGAATAFPNSFTLTPTGTASFLTVTRRAGLGQVQVSYGTNAGGGNKSIDRIWITSASVNGAVQMSWLPDNDNDLSNFAQAVAWGRTAAPVAGSGWARISSAQNAGARTATGTAPAYGLSFFTVGTAESPLPVTLVEFEAQCVGSEARLSWRTA